MVTDYEIRVAELSDVDTLAAFNCAIAAETEDRQLPLETVRRGVERGLRHAPEVTYFVAQLANSETSEELRKPLVGCLMLTREWSDWRDGWLAWVQSVYVVPEQRGRGVFRRLLETATEHLRQSPDVVGMRLYVEVENEDAQAVYARSGFGDPNYKVLEKMF